MTDLDITYTSNLIEVYFPNNSSYTLIIKPDISDWCMDNMDYVPEINHTNKHHEPPISRKVLLRFQDEDDAMIFQIRYADHWTNGMGLIYRRISL